MKHRLFSNLISVIAFLAVTFWLAACATQTTAVAGTSMERALLNAHFKVRTATTAEQRNHLRSLPDNRFATVKEGGETYFLFPDKKDDRLYVGDHWAYQAFINDKKNDRLRRQGAFVFETDPSNRADNRTVVIWHGWSPFQKW